MVGSVGMGRAGGRGLFGQVRAMPQTELCEWRASEPSGVFQFRQAGWYPEGRCDRGRRSSCAAAAERTQRVRAGDLRQGAIAGRRGRAVRGEPGADTVRWRRPLRLDAARLGRGDLQRDGHLLQAGRSPCLGHRHVPRAERAVFQRGGDGLSAGTTGIPIQALPEPRCLRGRYPFGAVRWHASEHDGEPVRGLVRGDPELSVLYREYT